MSDISIFNHTMTIGDFTYGCDDVFDIYIDVSNLQDAIEDVHDEGSGVLEMSCVDSGKFHEFCLITSSMSDYFYAADVDTLQVSVIIEERDLPYLKKLSNFGDDCEQSCKCINCTSELEEENETVCRDGCGCINCR